ncbi:MAG TPA: RNA 2',3'-cyclic phosphodiesterase [Prolixibacteraceae bacterium]|nr:RNA 2',3'-cyclic phosphodiesterase [Prolixibacteraceae bacterium]
MKRLFIGIPVQSANAANLAETWRNDRELNDNRFSWTNPENWHITLFFLGDTAVSEIDLLWRLIDASFGETRAFNTELNGVGVFPDTGNPKVLWIGLKDIQHLLPAREKLGELLMQNGFAFDNKPLKPHLTLGRIKSLQNRQVFEELLKDYGEFLFDNVTIDQIVLYESILTQQGPVYKPLFVKQLIWE